MVEQEQKPQQQFKLTQEGPKVFNENSPQNKFTETIYKIERDGNNIVEVRNYEEHYVIYWNNSSITPNQFFSAAQEFVNNIKDKAQPLAKKAFKGLDYGLNDNPLVELDIEIFSPQEELEQKGLIFARFNTPYADFGWEAERPDGKEGTEIWLITHVNLPEEFTEFVVRNSEEEIPKEMLNDVLVNVGSSVATVRAKKTSKVA